MPKPNKFTIAQITDALKSAKGFMSLAAKTLGCDYSTVWKYVKRYPAIQKVIDEEREVMKDVAEGSLLKQIQEGNTTAIIFYLKTQAPERGYSEKAKGFTNVIVNTPPNTAIPQEINTLSNEELMAALNGEIRKALGRGND